jgi:hypothetical protein
MNRCGEKDANIPFLVWCRKISACKRNEVCTMAQCRNLSWRYTSDGFTRTGEEREKRHNHAGMHWYRHQDVFALTAFLLTGDNK